MKRVRAMANGIASPGISAWREAAGRFAVVGAVSMLAVSMATAQSLEKPIEERVKANEAGAEVVQWQTRPRREERRPKPRPQQQPQQHHRPKRASTITAAPYGAPATEVAAKPAEAQPPRHEHKRKDRKGGERDDKPRPQRRPDKPFVVDPDSPFAALAALKFRK